MTKRTVASVGICLVLAGAFGVQRSHANGFRNPPPDSYGLSMDGGKLTGATGPAAAYYNPANLVGVTGPGAELALTIVSAETEFSSPLLGKHTTTTSEAYIPGLFACYPFADGKVVGGLAIVSPYGQSTEWAKSSMLPYFSELVVVDIAPSVAFGVGDRLRIGVGMDFYLSELDLRQLVPWDYFPIPWTGQVGSLRVSGDGTAIGGNLALSVDLTPHQRLAVTYRSQFDVDYDGDTDIGGIPPALTPVLPAGSDFSSTIKFPNTVVVGYGIQATDRLYLGADVEWIEFSRFDELPLDLGAIGQLNLFPSAIPQDWDDVWTVGLAAAWTVSDAIVLRGTYKFMESPIPDTTLAPTLPDSDKHVLGVGAQWSGDVQSVAVGYLYTIFDDRTVAGNANPMFNGAYELSSHIGSVSYACRF